MIELKNVSKVYKNAEETAVKGYRFTKRVSFCFSWAFRMWEKHIITNDRWPRRNFFGDFINERVANDLEPKDRNLSMVFQNYALYPHLSVEENILFGLKVRKVQKEAAKEINGSY